MVYCVAFGCQNRDTDKRPGVTFHIFPKDEQRRAAWTKAVSRANWAPSTRSHLCSVHFCKEFIDRTSLSVVRLRENAVPTIFSAYPTYLQTPKTKSRRTRKRKATDLEVDHLASSEPSTSQEDWAKQEIKQEEMSDEDNEPFTKINPDETSGRNNLVTMDVKLLRKVVLAVNRLKDDCYIFGDFVANQLRLISVQPLRLKLQSRIQKAILRVAEEDELLQ